MFHIALLGYNFKMAAKGKRVMFINFLKKDARSIEAESPRMFYGPLELLPETDTLRMDRPVADYIARSTNHRPSFWLWIREPGRFNWPGPFYISFLAFLTISERWSNKTSWKSSSRYGFSHSDSGRVKQIETSRKSRCKVREMSEKSREKSVSNGRWTK